MEFLGVYVREAHPSDGWSIEGWSKIEDAKSFDERRDAAALCSRSTESGFPILVDTMDDRTAVEYAAWPERLFVIDKGGRVAYAGKQGPWGYYPVKRMQPFKGRMGKTFDLGPSLEEFLEGFTADPASCK